MLAPSETWAPALDPEPVSMGVVALALLVLSAADAIQRAKRRRSQHNRLALPAAPQSLRSCDDALSPL